jgi:hypothetical protein
MGPLPRLAFLLLLVALPLSAWAQDEEAQSPDDEATEEGFPAPPSDAGAPAEPLPEPEPPQVDLARGEATLYAEGYEAFAAGDFATAALYFEEVLRRRPSHPSARNYLVECYLALGFDDAAGAIREGGVPGGEATPIERPRDESVKKAQDERFEAEEAEPELTEEEKAHRRNPRTRGFGSIAFQLFGPSIGPGFAAEFRPHWLFSIGGGAGGIGIITNSGNTGLGAVFLEGTIRPIPFRLTPTIGVGVTMAAGQDAWRLDSFSRSLAGSGRVRFVPWFSFGLRYDAPNKLFLSTAVALIPTGNASQPLLPFPGFRVGARF